MTGVLMIEFVGGPQDGTMITIDVPPILNSAPEWIRMPVVDDMSTVVPGQSFADGYTVHLYHGPAGDEELEAAATAYAEGAPVKYRYAGEEGAK